MADNTTLNAMSGGDTIQTEDFGSAGKIQRMKLALGAKDSDIGDVTTTNPLPVLISNLTVSGTTASGFPGLNFPTTQTIFQVQNLPNLISVSGTNLHVFVDNLPTYRFTRLADMSGNILGVPTAPLTVSGTMDLMTNTSVTYSGVAAAGFKTVKATAGIVDGYMVYNPNSSVAYVQLFDNTNPTLGTTFPDMIIPVPATSAANLSAVARQFNNAIKLACTTTAGGSTPPTTGLDMTIFYK